MVLEMSHEADTNGFYPTLEGLLYCLAMYKKVIRLEADITISV